MITLVEQEESQQALLRLCGKTSFGCKIYAAVASYGFDKGFACFWLDDRSDAVFCQTDNVMVISGTVGDPKETLSFLRAVGPSSVICAVRNAEALGLSQSQSGDVLKKQLPPGKAVPPEQREVNIREIYALLEGTGMVAEFEPFYLDLSHKLRRGAALAVTEHRGEELAGCAIVSAIGKNAVILSALAVAKPYRRQGVGSGMFKQVEAFFPGKTLYVFRERGRNREFYRELGCSKVDTWVQASLS